MKGLWTALSFLTILPVRNPESRSPGDFGKAVLWFPMVGVLIGGLLIGAYWLLRDLPAGVRSAMLLMLWVILSGGLHLDGLADCLDGLFASTTIERRLEIMRDSRTGAYAVVGMVVVLLLKNAALGSISSPEALLLAPAAGRSALLLGALFPSARSSGLGAAFRDALSPVRAAAALVPLLVLAVLFGIRGVLAVFVSALAAFLVFNFARLRIGGISGDVLGAACELVEVLVLILFVVVS